MVYYTENDLEKIEQENKKSDKDNPNALDVPGEEDNRGLEGGNSETGVFGMKMIWGYSILYGILIFLSSVAILIYIRKRDKK